ncbi:hypothetical protein IQ268_06605 [Oculatella sp. LEGE 06141]|uniref:hypothetical protein n=1 Tax=Oculatella sp. LEGE 06141 TaxID=1828648 RepID=UPI00187F9EAD|nr:hypothetical protein [Oculatella sp. LEGE 06141]MBE9178255.1 hypothetical protein [Oculatella sp. LEGE 06141]
MFLDELSPVFKELTGHPLEFLGGFFSGMLRLNLADDPVKNWLNQQTGTSSYSTTSADNHNGKSSGPQSISID